jgi:hypothetical protein
LAIELAAARVSLFSPGQIAERLDDRFKLLTGGSRSAVPRQQTLQALIDWSYQSLNEIEQRALRRLAVFSGGWTFEAAESALGGSEALDGLLGLVNKSLVNVEEQDGKSRYYFLETIRQYALEKLVESGEAVEARDRQLDYVMNLEERAYQGIFAFEHPESLDQTEAEHDNLRAALEWATSNHPEKALKLAQAVGGFWTARDYNNEAREWCKQILKRTENMRGLASDRARLYALSAWSSMTMGDPKPSRADAEQSIALARESNDMLTLVRAHGTLALASIFLGDFRTAKEAVVAGEKIAREHDFKGELALILSTHAQLVYYGEADIVKAREYLNETAELAHTVGYQWASTLSIFGLARTAAAVGDLVTARAGFKESAEIAMKMGNKRIVYSSQSEFAHILRAHGELEEALATYRDLLPKWKDLGHRPAVAHELECVAYILIRKEEPVRAATLLGAAQSLRESIDSVMTVAERAEYEKEIAALHAGMQDADFEHSWSQGRALSIEQAIAYALEPDSAKQG